MEYTHGNINERLNVLETRVKESKTYKVNVGIDSNDKLGLTMFVDQILFKTCNCDSGCNKTCYATKGNMANDTPLISRWRNYFTYTIMGATYYKNSIIGDIYANLQKYKDLHLFRWHSSGDIIDDEYFKVMVAIAKKFKKVSFYAYTKKCDIVNKWLDNNGLEKLPNNLNIIFSAYDKNYTFSNPYNLPVAYIDFKDKSLNPVFPVNAYKCPNQSNKAFKCDKCKLCSNLKIGESVIFKQH